MDTQSQISTLERLLEVCRISHKGYSDAAQHVQDPVLQSRFNQFAQQRALFIERITKMLNKKGGSPKEAESFEGNMMRMWIDFKSGLIGNDNQKIINQCLKEEETTLIEFDNAKSENTLSAEVTPTIMEMNEEIKASYKKLKELATEYSDN